MSLVRVSFVVVSLVMIMSLNQARAEEKVLRVGIIGCDTSHVPIFTKLMNDPKAEGNLAKVQVTVAFPAGSPDLPDSRDRVQKYTKEIQDAGVKIVDSLEALAAESDAVLLESVDGRPHLEQFRAVAKGKPVFIDKPMAVSLADVLSIYRIADETKTPVFCSSSLRFWKELQEAAKSKKIGPMLGAETIGPLHLQPFHPDLFFYGIHGVEPLFAVMGPGCESVSRTDTPLSAVVVGKWKDGRIGSYRGLKKGSGYAFTVVGEKGVIQGSGFKGYDDDVRAISKFFVSHEVPFDRQQTIEIYAFMEAADESKANGGAPVRIADVIERAHAKSAQVAGK